MAMSLKSMNIELKKYPSVCRLRIYHLELQIMVYAHWNHELSYLIDQCSWMILQLFIIGFSCILPSFLLCTSIFLRDCAQGNVWSFVVLLSKPSNLRMRVISHFIPDGPCNWYLTSINHQIHNQLYGNHFVINQVCVHRVMHTCIPHCCSCWYCLFNEFVSIYI